MNKDFYSNENMLGAGVPKQGKVQHNSSEAIGGAEFKIMPGMTEKKFDPMGNTKSVDARSADK